MSEQGAVLRIDIYSDVICPWCYVGKRRLERALARLRGVVPARITWRPFQLNPAMPNEGMDRKAYLEAKFGSLDAFRQMEEHLLAAGAAEQISFAFNSIAVTPNTLHAHRLIWHAAQQGCQDEVVDRLFKGYFEEGADIGSLPTLARLAEQAGLKAESFLRTDEGIAQVKTEEAKGRRLGIRAVPYFVLNRECGISGAQQPDVLAAAIEEAWANGEPGLAGRR